jgi:predicted RNA-binding Zn-ribbon protein involved in translation (DUF1610 family)
MQEQQQVKSAGATDVQPTDIVFECPQCGKSLAIDPRGIGLVVVCPDCQTQVQVPAPRLDEAELSDEDTGGEELGVDLAERVRLLERFHALDQERLQQISAEMGLIQAALDRVVTLLNDAQTPPPGE